MPCTTLLAGRTATYDGSTMIARTDDGHFDIKRMRVVNPQDQPKVYKSVIGHCRIRLPKDPMRYTSCPSVDPKNGIWAASGINDANVGMTATETITNNPRVLGADPYVEYRKKTDTEKEVIGGFGEEDFVVLVLPYIHSAREGVLRLGAILEQYGTYESNGIAFNDEDEIWWMETIGGHHWIARRVPDDAYVMVPNRQGIDHFDFEDAFGEQKEYLCSSDLREFVTENHLDVSLDGSFNPRYAFGTHSDADRVYNNPRAWFMGRYFNPTTYLWDGEKADYTPECDDIPWALVPEHRITVEDIKYVLSSYYQGTPYNPYQAADIPQKGKYRPIGVSGTDVTTICQIRGYLPGNLKAVEWVSFSSNAFNAMMPVYPHVSDLPAYLKEVSLDVSTENLYWGSRLLGLLADAHYGSVIQLIERYQSAVFAKGHELVREYDANYLKTKKESVFEEANEALAAMMRKETINALNKVIAQASEHMKNGYSREDK